MTTNVLALAKAADGNWRFIANPRAYNFVNSSMDKINEVCATLPKGFSFCVEDSSGERLIFARGKMLFVVTASFLSGFKMEVATDGESVDFIHDSVSAKIKSQHQKLHFWLNELMQADP